MTTKPIAILLASLALLTRLVVSVYDRADFQLSSFYAAMLGADVSAARGRIDEAVRLWPWNSRYYCWRGYLLSQSLPSQCPHRFRGVAIVHNASDQLRARAALASYGQALELNRRDAVAYHNQAWLEHLSGDDDAAGRDWQEATLIDPLNAVFHLSYGMFLAETEHFDTGEDQIQEAVAISPSILDSPFFRRYRNRFPDRAESIAANCISKMEARLLHGSDPILEAKLGKLYLSTGNIRKSVELLQHAVDNLPNLALAWFNLGEAHATRGEIQDAIDCYQKANLIDNSLPGPYLRMGRIYLISGQKQLAARYFRQAEEQLERTAAITASHNNRLYIGPRQKIDDLLPATLVRYTTPCEISDAYFELKKSSSSDESPRDRALRDSCEQIPSPHSWP